MHIDLLNDLVEKGHTLKQLSEITGNTVPSIRYWLKKYNLKTKNSSSNSMKGAWEDKEKIINIIKKSYTIAEVLRQIDVYPNSGNYSTFKRFVLLNDVDISHFGRTNKPIHFDVPDLEKVLVENSPYSRKSLKKRLLISGIKKNICELCGIKDWMGKPIIMILDHINGKSNDNRIENLRMVCPNCNSQLPTHCRGYKKINAAKRPNCIDCGEPLKEKRSKRCLRCSHIANGFKMRKCERPPLAVLKKDVKKLGFSGTGRKYGFSDNAIRKWVKSVDESYFKKKAQGLKNEKKQHV